MRPSSFNLSLSLSLSLSSSSSSLALETGARGRVAGSRGSSDGIETVPANGSLDRSGNPPVALIFLVFVLERATEGPRTMATSLALSSNAVEKTNKQTNKQTNQPEVSHRRNLRDQTKSHRYFSVSTSPSCTGESPSALRKS